MTQKEMEIMLDEYDDSPVDWNKVKSSLQFKDDRLNIEYKRNLVGALIVSSRTKIYLQQKENITESNLKKIISLETLLRDRLMNESFESIKKIKL